ncbi:hypothetical protein [Donghicola sp. XS_ASV15]|uniref:hypothetical protein n=1 Tax=Donghicola sp. XS_ASV15 TaxID=3241295 RepID=UPI003517B3B8
MFKPFFTATALVFGATAVQAACFSYEETGGGSLPVVEICTGEMNGGEECFYDAVTVTCGNATSAFSEFISGYAITVTFNDAGEEVTSVSQYGEEIDIPSNMFVSCTPVGESGEEACNMFAPLN